VLLVASFWKTSLQRMPIWMMGVLILVLGLSTPITIMLRDSRVYEAAIFGCQFFFIGGCYWAYSSISGNKPVLWKLILGSIHWAFALGTRITVLPVIFFTAVATIIYIFKVFKTSTPKSYLPILAALGMPLLLAMAGLSWYNWARFESIFEFGIRYQLTNVDYNLFKESFSPRHITGNIYNYFAHPFDLRRKFPFIERIEFLPSNDRLAGLLFLCPYLLLAFAPLFRIFGNFRASQKDLAKQSETKSSEGWLIMIFAGSTIIAVSTILSFYFVTMRYMEDFMPSLMLLTTILLGREFQLIDRNKPLWKNLTYTTVAFALITISANLLIAIPRSGTIFMVDLLNSASKLLGLK
jgi:hypothetical protein